MLENGFNRQGIIDIDLTNPLLYTTRAMARHKRRMYLYNPVIPNCLASPRTPLRKLEATSLSWLDLDQVLTMLLDAYGL
jgi:hypothetical protein